MQVVVRQHGKPTCSPNTPLWQRAPTHGSDGRALGDFMMLIPGLGKQPEAQLKETITTIQQVFNRYPHVIVFADLNLRLNVLWVSIKPVPGMVLEIATAINACVPGAKLVAQKFD